MNIKIASGYSINELTSNLADLLQATEIYDIKYSVSPAQNGGMFYSAMVILGDDAQESEIASRNVPSSTGQYCAPSTPPESNKPNLEKIRQELSYEILKAQYTSEGLTADNVIRKLQDMGVL